MDLLKDCLQSIWDELKKKSINEAAMSLSRDFERELQLVADILNMFIDQMYSFKFVNRYFDAGQLFFGHFGNLTCQNIKKNDSICLNVHNFSQQEDNCKKKGRYVLISLPKELC